MGRGLSSDSFRVLLGLRVLRQWAMTCRRSTFRWAVAIHSLFPEIFYGSVRELLRDDIRGIGPSNARGISGS
jgi:hypothetical protein